MFINTSDFIVNSDRNLKTTLKSPTVDDRRFYELTIVIYDYDKVRISNKHHFLCRGRHSRSIVCRSLSVIFSTEICETCFVISPYDVCPDLLTSNSGVALVRILDCRMVIQKYRDASAEIGFFNLGKKIDGIYKWLEISMYWKGTLWEYVYFLNVIVCSSLVETKDSSIFDECGTCSDRRDPIQIIRVAMQSVVAIESKTCVYDKR